MRRIATGIVFIGALASAPLCMPRPTVQAREEPITWAKDLDGAIARAQSTGKALAILFR